MPHGALAFNQLLELSRENPGAICCGGAHVSERGVAAHDRSCHEHGTILVAYKNLRRSAAALTLPCHRVMSSRLPSILFVERASMRRHCRGRSSRRRVPGGLTGHSDRRMFFASWRRQPCARVALYHDVARIPLATKPTSHPSNASRLLGAKDRAAPAIATDLCPILGRHGSVPTLTRVYFVGRSAEQLSSATCPSLKALPALHSTASRR